MNREIEILETTLRDGSYAINYSFTSADTAIICKHLEDVGFRYIEIGHGVGLNAGNSGYGNAAATDEEYMIAAQKVLSKAKYGMFCIPNIARIEDVDMAADHNMQFIRVGTNVTEVPISEKFVKRAKHYGMFVAANYMKSYVLPPKEFAEQVKYSEEYGADVVYIVDSAGGMFSDDIRNYFDAIRAVSDITVGFHGHDNLGQAVSNCLVAARLGVKYLDSSLQGLGRSAGNAATEVLVASLIKMGFDLGIDLLKTLEIGYEYIRLLIPTKGRMPLDIVAGQADFHSSYMGLIQKYSSKYNVDPAVLIIEMSKIDKVKVEEGVLEGVARSIKDTHGAYTGKYGFGRYVGGEQERKS